MQVTTTKDLTKNDLNKENIKILHSEKCDTWVGLLFHSAILNACNISQGPITYPFVVPK